MSWKMPTCAIDAMPAFRFIGAPGSSGGPSAANACNFRNAIFAKVACKMARPREDDASVPDWAPADRL